MSDVTRVFISHATEDSSFAGRLAATLHEVGVSVWLDAAHAGREDLAAANTLAIESCDTLLLIVSPAALAAQWVTDEMNAGVARYKQGHMRAPVIVVAQPTPLDDAPPLWTAYVWIDATSDETAAIALLLKALNVTPRPPSQTTPAESALAAFLATPSQPLPWAPYPEAPAFATTLSPPPDLTRPSGPAFQRIAPPSQPLPWTPYPAAATLSPLAAEAPASLNRATIPLWSQRRPRRSKLWWIAEALVLLLPIGAFFARVLLGHADWADGLRLLGIVALAVAGVFVATVGLDTLRLRRLAISPWVGALLLALLVGGGVSGLAFNARLHAVQAHFFEARSQWDAAIGEFQRAGNNSADIARVHDEWGAARLSQGDFAGAVDQFTQERTLAQADDANDSRAQSGLFQTYTDWVQTNTNDVPYADAISFLDSYRRSATCDTTCQGTASATEAQAYYQYGSQLAQSGNQSAAIIVFETLQQQFPASSFGAQAHAAAAVAYYSLAQQDRTSNCRSSLNDYEQLADHYADTPQGASAKAALAAPVQVSGTLTNFPTNPTPTMYLSRSAYSSGFGGYQFSEDYAASVDAQTGAFAFTDVAQGIYYLNSSYGNWWIFTGTNKLFTWNVGPLCPYNLGQSRF